MKFIRFYTISGDNLYGTVNCLSLIIAVPYILLSLKRKSINLALKHIKIIVNSSFHQKLVMGSNLKNLSIMNNDYFICLSYAGKPVSDYYRGSFSIIIFEQLTYL